MKINIVGDFMPIGQVESAIISGREDTLTSDEIKSILNKSDLNVLNLECPLTNSKEPSLKTGKNYKASPNVIDFIEKHDFNLLCLANNHIMDFGVNGLVETLETCKKSNINCIGINTDNNLIYRHQDGNFKLSIINAAEQEFGVGNENQCGVLNATPEILYYKIQQERKYSDRIILILHGGREFFEYPAPERQALYRLFIDFGADMIVSHHTHVLSGYEWYHGKPILYSLGNFLFPFENHPIKGWYESLICSVDITKERLDFKLIPCMQCKESIIVRMMSLEETIMKMNNIQEINDVIGHSNKLKEKWNAFSVNEKMQYYSMLNLISRIKIRLYLKGFISEPKVNRQKLLTTLNILRCMSHKGEAIEIIETELKKYGNFFS